MLDIHRRYVEAGCDVISTNTWAILAAAELEAGGLTGRTGLSHWLDIARLGISLARQAVNEGAGAGVGAVAFSVNGDVDSEERLASLRLLGRVFADEPPDLLLLETMSLIRDDFTFRAVEAALETGLPVWLSFRRCRHGVCGVYGQHWGGPEGDLFGRTAKRFEELGVSALLINCLPPDHVEGMLPWLRDFTDLPLGVYPNLGYFSDRGWHFDERIGPAEYAELAARLARRGSADRRRLLWDVSRTHCRSPRAIDRHDSGPPPQRAAAHAGRRRSVTQPGPGSTRPAAACIRSSCPSSRSTRMSSSPRSGACSCGSTCSEAGSEWASAASTSAVAAACSPCSSH